MIHTISMEQFSNAEARCEGALFHLIRSLDTIVGGVIPFEEAGSPPSIGSTFPWAQESTKKDGISLTGSCFSLL